MGYRNYGPANGFIVSQDGNGDFITIGAALAAATSGQTIFLKPGTYTENVTIANSLQITGFTPDIDSVHIIGKFTITASAQLFIANVTLQTNNDYIFAITGNATSIMLASNCYVNASNHTAVNYTSSGSGTTIKFFGCSGNLATTGITYFTSTSTGQIVIRDCDFENSGGSTTASTISAANLSIINSKCVFPITTSSTATIQVDNSQFAIGSSAFIPITHGGGTNSCYIYNSQIASGSSSCISVGTGAALNVENVALNTSNTNPITGAGSVTYANVGFASSGTVINTTTQAPAISCNNAIKVTSPGAYPYTTLAQDEMIIVDTTSSRSIVPYASPANGQKHTIKDNTGSAGTNNITVTPSGKNIDGAASYVINTNFGAIDIVYNGTQWNIR